MDSDLGHRLDQARRDSVPLADRSAEASKRQARTPRHPHTLRHNRPHSCRAGRGRQSSHKRRRQSCQQPSLLASLPRPLSSSVLRVVLSWTAWPRVLTHRSAVGFRSRYQDGIAQPIRAESFAPLSRARVTSEPKLALSCSRCDRRHPARTLSRTVLIARPGGRPTHLPLDRPSRPCG